MVKEIKKLEGVYLSRLTNAEFSQFIDRQVTEIKALGTEILTDSTMNDLLANLETNGLTYHKAILQIQKSEYTDLLKKTDAARDRAVKNYEHALKQFKYSDNVDELNAFNKLSILSTTFKGIDVLNYEAETKELKKYLEALHSDQFSAEIALLALGGYIDKIDTCSAEFNKTYDSRSNESNTKAVYNALVIRKSLQNDYSHFTAYILALSNGLDKDPFNICLKIMNTTRSYYDDMVKRRVGVKNSETVPEKTETTA